MESFTTHLKKFPAPTIPLEGSLVKIRYDVDPLESELPEIVGTVAVQRFEEMRLDVSRAMLSRYSPVRMEAKRRALDEVAARQRAADERLKHKTERPRSLEAPGLTQ
jgi:hypothetical protein